MKLLKVFIALAILSIGISSAFPATTDLLRNSVSTAAGRVDYAMTYMPSAATGSGATTVGTPAFDASATDSVIKSYITGINIDKAVVIDSYLIAASAGGDAAAIGLTVVGTDGATGGDASVKNYAMYGYVTPNFAYTGQYADQIKGEAIDMESGSINKFDVAAIPAIAPANTRADFATLVAALPAIPASANNYGNANANLVTNMAPAGAPDFVASKVYQYAQAGGSATPSDYTQRNWVQAENAKGFTFTQNAGDTITENTEVHYQASNTRSMITNTILTVNNGDTLAPNDVSMGYADKNIVYSNIDTSLTNNDNTPVYTSGSSTNINGGGAVTTSAPVVAPHTPGTNENEVFVYSIVNSANPSGKSAAVFW